MLSELLCTRLENAHCMACVCLLELQCSTMSTAKVFTVHMLDEAWNIIIYSRDHTNEYYRHQVEVCSTASTMKLLCKIIKITFGTGDWRSPTSDGRLILDPFASALKFKCAFYRHSFDHVWSVCEQRLPTSQTFISIMWRLWMSYFYNYFLSVNYIFGFWKWQKREFYHYTDLEHAENIYASNERIDTEFSRWLYENVLLQFHRIGLCVVIWGSIDGYNLCHRLDTLSWHSTSPWNRKPVQKSRFHWTLSDESMSY